VCSSDLKLIDEKLNEEMANVRNIISEGLQMRAQAKIKVRQPLKGVSIKYQVSGEEMRDIIKEELNLKEVKIDEKQEGGIVLDTEITEELRLEGVARELIRHIQEMRKEAGYDVDNRIKVCYDGWSVVFSQFFAIIAKETLSDDISEGKMKDADLEKEFEIEEKKVLIGIRK
jgi:isoleucyl-tRNA synthetase